MDAIIKCYMCEKILENNAFITTTPNNDLIFLCGKCEHTVKEIEGDKCDFCSSKQVWVIYKCKDITLPEEFIGAEGLGIRALSSGDWVACQKCEEVIDRKDLNGLIDRCMMLVQKYFTRPEDREITIGGLKLLYTLFLNKFSGKELYKK